MKQAAYPRRAYIFDVTPEHAPTRTPLHSHLAHFPFVLWIVSFLFDIASTWRGPTMVEAALFNLVAGMVAAVAAAVTGWWDYARRLPKRSTSRRVARWHALASGLAMLLFLISLALRWQMRGAWATPRWPFVLSGLGVALMGLGSYVGGLIDFARFTTTPRSPTVR
jgi:uncharacterized membrane protein